MTGNRTNSRPTSRDKRGPQYLKPTFYSSSHEMIELLCSEIKPRHAIQYVFTPQPDRHRDGWIQEFRSSASFNSAPI